MPDPRNLKFLAGILPSMVDHHEEKRVSQGHVSVSKTKASKFCVICSAVYDFKLIAPEKLEEGNCPKCADMMSAGWTALVVTEANSPMHIFVKAKAFEDTRALVISEAIYHKVVAATQDPASGVLAPDHYLVKAKFGPPDPTDVPDNILKFPPASV